MEMGKILVYTIGGGFILWILLSAIFDFDKWTNDYQCVKYERSSEGTCNPDIIINCTFVRNEKQTQIESCFCVSDNSTFERKCIEQVSIRRYKK